MRRKKLPAYTMVGDKVTMLLKADAEQILRLLYAADFDENTEANRKECLRLIALLEREIHRYDQQ